LQKKKTMRGVLTRIAPHGGVPRVAKTGTPRIAVFLVVLSVTCIDQGLKAMEIKKINIDVEAIGYEATSAMC
jgi:hypothetical protein